MKNKNLLQKKKIFLSAGAILAMVLFCFALSLLGDMFGIKLKKEVLVSVPQGAGIREVSRILKEEKIIRFPFAFRFSAKKGDYVIRQGGHKLNRSMSYKEIMKKLCMPPESGSESICKVLIPEGYELSDIAKALEKEGLCSEEEFLKEAERGSFDYEFLKDIKRDENRLEGYLFPATYEIQRGESAHSIIDKMLDAFSKKIVPVYKGAQTDYSLDEIITLASIIEREAANDSERPVISSVFYNRMEKDMTLSSCATVQYVLKERKKVLSVSDTKIKSPYNTYRIKGLPPGPIASPGEASVKAALYPEKTDYLYFAAKPDGSGSVFSKTGEEHMQNAEKLK